MEETEHVESGAPLQILQLQVIQVDHPTKRGRWSKIQRVENEQREW